MTRLCLTLVLSLTSAPLWASNLTDETPAPSTTLPGDEVAATEAVFMATPSDLAVTIGGSAMLPGLDKLQMNTQSDLQSILQPVSVVDLLK